MAEACRMVACAEASPKVAHTIVQKLCSACTTAVLPARLPLPCLLAAPPTHQDQSALQIHINALLVHGKGQHSNALCVHNSCTAYFVLPVDSATYVTEIYALQRHAHTTVQAAASG